MDHLQGVNQRWFGIHCSRTHTAEGYPVTPLLEALDQCQTDLVLQLDSDLMLCPLLESPSAGVLIALCTLFQLVLNPNMIMHSKVY